MEVLKIDKANARKLFKTAAPEFKTMLVDTFGESFFSEKITDRIKTYIDVCLELKIDASYSLPFPTPENDEEKAVNAFVMLRNIAKVLNEGWTPDWDNSSQAKYYPWFDMRSSAGSGSGLSFDVYADDSSGSRVGSRLCFKTRELAEYAAKQFVEVYRDYMKK
jgi:hypothetical protein